MSNTLDVLSQKLAVALRDTTYNTWDSEEMDDIIKNAVADLYPRLARELPYSSTTITLVTGTYVYAAPTGVLAISRLDWVNTSSDEMGPLQPGSWEVMGDPLAGALYVHVSPTVADSGGTLRVVGYGRYDTSTNLIPNDYVRLVLSTARLEAYRRMAGKRTAFAQWSSSQQQSDTSVIELMQLISDANNEAEDQRRKHKTWMRPVPGRHG